MVYTSVFVIMTLPKELLAYMILLNLEWVNILQYPAIRRQTLNKQLP